MIKIGKNYLAFSYFWVKNRFKRYYRDGFLGFGLFPIKRAPEEAIYLYYCFPFQQR